MRSIDHDKTPYRRYGSDKGVEPRGVKVRDIRALSNMLYSVVLLGPCGQRES